MERKLFMYKNWLYDSCPIDNDYFPDFESDFFHPQQNTLNIMAIDAYIYGYPLVLMDVTKNNMLTSGTRINHFLNERAFPNPEYTTIIRPNVDTLYSMAWLDLSQGPIILSVPDTHHVYYLMELLDAWTNVFASIGTRTTGTREGAFAITGPEWNGIIPEETIRIESPTNTVWIIGRTQTDGPNHYPLVHAIQDNYTLLPLSLWGNSVLHDQSDSASKPINISPANQVANMDAAIFFQTMMKVLSMNPPWIEDPGMNSKLAALGLIPSKTFDFYRLHPSVKHALNSAIFYAPRLIRKEYVKKFHSQEWALLLKDMGFYGIDYMQRAIIAMTGIGANLTHDSVYGPIFTDNDGIPLAGYNNYNIHFNKGQFPPVNAFWSITAYNDKGFLISNPIDRYALSPHLSKLNYNVDGSLDIVVGNASPGNDYLANWLPVSNGSFNLILRMYWPKQPALNGQWSPPAIIRI